MFVHGFQEEVGDLWQETLQHPFVQSLADGTLEKEAFYYYLLQDDYYLSHFEKVIEKSVAQAGTAELAAEMREVQRRLQQSELLMREQFYPRVGLRSVIFPSENQRQLLIIILLTFTGWQILAVLG